jgi:hypothetical protein
MEIKREIFEVHLAYVNAEGFHACDPSIGGKQYPIVVDSKNNGNNIDYTLKKAYGYLGAAESVLSTRDDQVGYCYIIRVSDGYQIEKRVFGKLEPVIVPDPEPEGGES